MVFLSAGQGREFLICYLMLHSLECNRKLLDELTGVWGLAPQFRVHVLDPKPLSIRTHVPTRGRSSNNWVLLRSGKQRTHPTVVVGDRSTGKSRPEPHVPASLSLQSSLTRHEFKDKII